MQIYTGTRLTTGVGTSVHRLQKSALVTQLEATCIVASRISMVIILFAMKIGVSIFKAWLLGSEKKN